MPYELLNISKPNSCIVLVVATVRDSALQRFQLFLANILDVSERARLLPFPGNPQTVTKAKQDLGTLATARSRACEHSRNMRWTWTTMNKLKWSKIKLNYFFWLASASESINMHFIGFRLLHGNSWTYFSIEQTWALCCRHLTCSHWFSSTVQWQLVAGNNLETLNFPPSWPTLCYNCACCMPM